MKQRVITAIALLSLLAVVVWQIYTPIFIIVISVFSAIAANEIMKCAKVSNKFILVLGTAAAFLIPFFSSASILEPIISSDVWFNIIGFVPKFVWVTLIILAFFLAMLSDYANTKFEDVAVSIVASLIVPAVFSIFGILRDITGYSNQLGVYFIFYALICALATDTGAQLGGMAFGKTKMSPNISPKKTIEGAVCGIIFSIILNAVAIMLYNRFAIIGLTKTQATVLLVAVPFISFMGMMGDLTASVLKRNFGVKDFGKIFPGHGGVMDRFDSTLFTLPLTYCVAIFIYGA
ncbi:MAG: phosphatidate cytidylyltransferase [Eubacterium sp.]|nr:phosphatidate cytidylyltransferase [Eubacterium sp.]